MRAAVEVDGLVKSYGGLRAVDGITLSVAEGETLGVLGPNGAGKTTTVECVAGLRQPDGGRVRVLGHDPWRERSAVRAVLGVQLQGSSLPDRITPREALRLQAACYRAPADVAELVEVLGLGPRLDARYVDLSGGQQQRLSLALALVGRPRVAVLDELTTGLDPRARRGVWELVRRQRDCGVATLLVTHAMEEAERLCDRVAVVDAGRIVALDTPARLVEELPSGQVLRFVPSAAVDVTDLAALPDVVEAESDGPAVVVRGGPDALGQVVVLLARRGVVARQLRLDAAGLDDAYLALTGGRDRATQGEQIPELEEEPWLR